VRKQSATRRQLEEKLRSILPRQEEDPSAEPSNPLVASVGLGGLLAGYSWGWIRGRRRRAKKSS